MRIQALLRICHALGYYQELNSQDKLVTPPPDIGSGFKMCLCNFCCCSTVVALPRNAGFMALPSVCSHG
jgi:hypothetical protein